MSGEPSTLRVTVTAEFPRFEPVTYTAWQMEIRSTLSGRVDATALVCPAANYDAINWPGIDRFERPAGHSALWRQVAPELKATTIGAALGAGSSTLRLLVSDRTSTTELVVTAIHHVTATPQEIRHALDRLLAGETPT